MCLPAKKIYAFLPQVSDKTEVGLLTTYNWQTSNVSLGLAGKYVMDDGAVMKVKESLLFTPCNHPTCTLPSAFEL